jgi:hypothetical protein
LDSLDYEDLLAEQGHDSSNVERGLLLLDMSFVLSISCQAFTNLLAFIITNYFPWTDYLFF